MSWTNEVVDLSRWTFAATTTLLFATGRAFAVVGSITWIVHSLGPDTLGSESSRSALAASSSTLLAFLTSGLISASNSNNGEVRATVSKLVGSGKMLMTLVGMLKTGCAVQQATAAYVDAIASAAQSDVPGSGDAHEKSGSSLKEAIVQAHTALASSNAEVFKSVVDQLNKTQGVYGRLVAIRSSRQQPPIVLGYWVTTAISAALTALISIDEDLSTTLVTTCLASVPTAALYLASVPDPLGRGNSWTRASRIRLELESLRKYTNAILAIQCPEGGLTFSKLMRQNTTSPERGRLLQR